MILVPVQKSRQFFTYYSRAVPWPISSLQPAEGGVTEAYVQHILASVKRYLVWNVYSSRTTNMFSAMIATPL